MKYTKESLQNTWGVVESKEHAEFIIELAELHGFDVWMPSDGLIRITHFVIYGGEIKMHSHDCANAVSRMNLKQITIPLPPKAKEWPQVGDEVEVRHDSGQVLKGELLAITSEYAIIQQLGHEQHLYLSAWKFSKPKTPEEELRDDVEYAIHHFEGDKVAGRKWLMSKYNITKKDKVDE